MPLNGFLQFTKGAVAPEEVYSLTGGLATLHPLEDIRTGLGQLPKVAKKNAWEMFTTVKNLMPPKTKIIKDIRMMPMPNIPDLDKEHLEELNKKRLMSLEAGNVHRNR